MYVTDLEGNEYALQATSTNEYELNGSQNLSMKILPSKVNQLFIENLTEMWTVSDHDGVEHKIIYFKRQGQGVKQVIDIKAIPLFYDDMNRQRIHRRIDQHLTANAFFHIVFNEQDELGNVSGYNFILNGTFDAIQWEGLGEGSTRLDMFKNGLNRYKAEFRIVGNTIYIENLIGRDTQFMYRYRLNASNIVLEHDATEFYTYAKGYGDYGDGEGGDDWQNAKLIREYTSPLANIIGIREAPPIKNGNITTTATMDSQLKILVNESLKISVSVTLHDLRKQGYALAQPMMGDRVYLIDERIGLNDEVRVVDMKLTRDWRGNVLDIGLTFGTPGLVRRHQANLQSAVKNITNLLEGKIKLPFSVLDNAVAEATKALTRMQSELTISENGSLLAIDKTNPNNLVMLNAAGLGVSDDGGATFENAITGQGINGRAIIAKTVLADVIAGGILTSLNDNTEFNLNDGMLDFYSTASIRFNDSFGGIRRNSGGQTSFVSFPISLGTTYPMVALGTNTTGGSLNVNDSDFRGIRIHPLNSDQYNNVVGSHFAFTENVNTLSTGGIVIKPGWDGTSRGIYPVNTGNYGYDLGLVNNRWANAFLDNIRSPLFYIRNTVGTGGYLFETQAESGSNIMRVRGINGNTWSYYLGEPGNNAWSFGYINHLRPSGSSHSVGASGNAYNYVYADSIVGTVVGTSTKNAKMSIEDVDGKQAFDYFNMMDIKSFFYKDSDITNKYNRKVSPIIEQLDPILENLYKATDDGLDINSNLFLLALALQYKSRQIDERLEMLENGA